MVKACVVVIGVSLLLGGCHAKMFSFLPGMPSDQEEEFEMVVVSRCSVLPEQDAKPLSSSELIAFGNSYLEASLTKGSNSRQAIDCFSRALRLMPESYEAQLGMGVAYLERAKYDSGGGAEQSDLLQGARSLLGRAYMLRHGAYEPLYYLAEIAIMEGELSLAKDFLGTLQNAGVKEGAVSMLLGRVHEIEGRPAEAQVAFEKAYYIGWPAEVVTYAKKKMKVQNRRIWDLRNLQIKIKVEGKL
jgi:tetratricopeptide (TPR) repeat protein